jgi:hypothetical protein
MHKPRFERKRAMIFTQRERNGATFRTSLFHHSNPSAAAAPPHPEPTVNNDTVKLHGIPCWTKQVDPEEITAELDYNLEEEDEEEQEYDDADVDTSDAPATSVINTYLRAIQTRLKYEVLSHGDRMVQACEWNNSISETARLLADKLRAMGEKSEGQRCSKEFQD